MTDPLIASLLPNGKPSSQGQSALAAQNRAVTTSSQGGIVFNGAMEQAMFRLNPETANDTTTLPPQLLALLKQGNPADPAAIPAGRKPAANPFAFWPIAPQQAQPETAAVQNTSPLQQLLDTASEFMSNQQSGASQKDEDVEPDFTAMAQFFALPVRVEQTASGALLADGIVVTPESAADGRAALPPVERALAALQINTRRLDLLLQQAGVNFNDYPTAESLQNPHFQRALADVLKTAGADAGQASIDKVMGFVAQMQQNPAMLTQLAKPAQDERLALTPGTPAPAASATQAADPAADTASGKTLTNAAVKDLSDSMKPNASASAPVAMAQAQMPQDQTAAGDLSGAGDMGVESLGDNAPAQQGSQTQSAPPAGGKPAPAPGAFAHHLHEASVRDQVNVRIQQAVREGVDKISVKLQPQELGKVEINIEMAGDGITRLSVTADSRTTLDMLQRNARELEKALLDAGLKADSGSLSFNLRGDGQPQQSFGQNERYPHYGSPPSGMSEDEALAALEGATKPARELTLNPNELNIVI